MANQTLIVGNDPGDDYTTLDAALQSILTGSDYVDGTTTTTIRVKGPNSGGPSQYQGDYSDLTSNSGGYLVACQIEAYDPSDKPVFDGSVNPRVPFIRADGSYEASLPTSYKSSFSNIIFQNYIGLSTSAGSGFFYGSSGGSVDFTGCEFTNIVGGECLQRYSSDDDRQAIVDSCTFINSQYGILRGSGNEILVKNCVFSNFQRGSAPNDLFFAKIHVTGGSTKVFNNSVAVSFGGFVTQDVISAVSASNNAVLIDPNGGNIDGIYTEEYGGNVVYFSDSSTGNEINAVGNVQDLGSNITNQTPGFIDVASNDLSISAASAAAQNGIELSDVTDDIEGTPRGILPYLRGGFLLNEVIYDAGAYQITTEIASDRLKSGMISPTARLMLQNRDSATGSYPTIIRTGDPDFTGKYDSEYDDTNTVVFNSNVSNVAYPMMLPSGTKFVKNDLLYPDYFDFNDRAIVTNGNVRAGISDVHVAFTPGENISPFDESRIYLDNDSQFYATGTASGTLPGFSQRLSSKTSFSFSYSTPDPTVIFFATNSLGDKNPKTLGAGSGVGYFNFERSQWEMLEPENVDCYASGAQDRQKSVFCFQPDNGYAFSTDDRVVRNVGLPVSDYGFPAATQYNATGSQCLEASSFLTDPFLLEKIRIHVSGIFGLNAVSNTSTPFVKQFFVLNQPTPANSNVSSSFDQVNYITGVGYGQQYQRQGLRDLVAWGNVSFTPTSSDFDGNTIWDTDISVSATETNIQRGHTGSFTMELVPRIATFSEGLGSFAVREQGGELGNDSGTDRELSQLRNNLGSRDLRGSPSGRSFIKSIPGSIVSASITLSGMSSFGERGKAFIPNTPYETSPYVLMPNDRLVFGWNSHPRRVGNAFSIAVGSNPGEEQWTRFADEISSFKVELFGSLLQNNLPKEPETNQPLTSDAVHEDLHYNNPVYDQWDVEPYSALSGSYVDLVITGSMIPDGARGAVSSVAAGQAGTTGSLQRFVRLTDSVGKLYDSYPLDPIGIASTEGVGLFNFVNAASVYLFGDADGGTGFEAVKEYYKAFAYEPRYSSVDRLTDANLIGRSLKTSDGTFQPFLGFYLTGSVELFKQIGDTGYDTGFFVSPTDPGTNTNDFRMLQAGYKAFYGFGRPIAFREVEPVSPDTAKYVTPDIRGYKYGLAGLFGSSLDVRFRRDRYGQFRDMLEGRRYPATLVNNAVEYPVEIAFVERDSTTGGTVDPLQTHSQNLDTHASSSMPYFDGLTVDRSDNPDETLVPVEVS